MRGLAMLPLLCLALLFSAIVRSSPAAAAPAECFPACRRGYVCSPEKTCVSECNPPCGAGETCRGGECVAKSESSEPAAPAAPARVAVLVGPAFQVTGSSEGSSNIVAASGAGVTAALRYELGDAHRFFVGPRFQLLFYGGTVPELGVDVGYRGRFGSGKLRAGPIVWLEPQAWFPHYVFPYIGAKAGAFLEYGPLFVDAALGGGAAFDTTQTDLQVGFSFTTGAEVGALF